MAANDNLSPHQFGKHCAAVTKSAQLLSNGNFRGMVEVAASRKNPVNTGYQGKHAPHDSRR